MRRSSSAILLAALALAPRAAEAHTTGISQSDLVVAPDGSVDAELVFAVAEIASAVGLDANHDGTVTQAELDAAAPDVKRLVLDGLEVRADDAPCAPSFLGATPTESDGLAIRARYACPPARRVDATYFLLSELAPGHRHAARIAQGARSTQKLLSGTSRAIGLDLAAPARRAPTWRRTAALVTAFAWAAAMLGLFVWRWRRRPRRPTS